MTVSSDQVSAITGEGIKGCQACHKHLHTLNHVDCQGIVCLYDNFLFYDPLRKKKEGSG